MCGRSGLILSISWTGTSLSRSLENDLHNKASSQKFETEVEKLGTEAGVDLAPNALEAADAIVID